MPGSWQSSERYGRPASCLERDTVDAEKSDTNRSVVFHFNGLTAVATQLQDSLIPTRPADVWFVFGGDYSE